MTGAGGPRRARISPLWTRAAARVFRSGLTGLLLVLAMGVAVAAAASAPLFSQSAGNDALRSVLAAVPDSAFAQDAPVVRLVGSQSPSGEDQRRYLAQLQAIDGLSDEVVTGVSVGAEVQGVRYPVVRANGTTVTARLAAVPDPASALDVTRDGEAGAEQAGNVWLPDPLADTLGVGPGDIIEVGLDGAPLPPPVTGGPAPGPATLTVAGTYAVAADGRRPADPPGTTAWSARRGALPSDSAITSRPAWLLVTDVATTERVAADIGDDILWAVEAQLRPNLSLEEADAAAAGVAELRRDTRSPQSAEESVLRVGVVSGIEALVGRADTLAEASARRARLWSGAGVATGLIAVLAVAVLAVSDRRRELAHGAATGVGPGRVAALWSVETGLPALAALGLGFLGALLANRLAHPESAGPAAAGSAAMGVGAAAALTGVVIVATVGAGACVALSRPVVERAPRRAPWLVALVVATGVALLAALTAPVGAPGPVEIATPLLVAASLGALAAMLVGFAFRRLGRRAGLPGPRRSGRWLARRRIAALGTGQVLVVAAVAVGLGMAMLAAASVNATRTVVADRIAVVAGAQSTAQIEGSWQLDKTAARTPTQEELADGARVPRGRTPPMPDGQVFVWRSRAAIEGLFGYRDLLLADPERFAETASWGEGEQLAQARDLVRALAEPLADGQPVPVIAVGEESLQPGDAVVVSGQAWQVAARVVASIDAFPGLQDVPMLIAADDAWLHQLGANDPRLAPTPGSMDAPRPYFEADVWSSGSVDQLVDTLQAQAVLPKSTTSAEQAAQAPGLMAATFSQGFQVAIALLLILAAAVTAALYVLRVAARQRGADLLLARVGMSLRGVRAARTWELTVLVGTSAVAAATTVLLMRPLGRALLDLQPNLQPRLVLDVGWSAWAALGCAALVVLLTALGAAWFDGRTAARPGSASGEEAVLRAGR